MKANILFVLATAAAIPFNAIAKDDHSNGHPPVSEETISQQRHNLAKNTEGKGFGP